MFTRLLTNRVGLERQYDAHLREQSTDAIDRGGALHNKPLPRPVHHQCTVLLNRFDRHKTHLRPGHGLANGFFG